MGDIIRKVKLGGLTLRNGRWELIKPWQDCPEVDALIDTGSTASVITRAIAELAGAEIVPETRKLHGRWYDGAHMAVLLEGCGPSKHLVIVNDRIAALAAAPQVYMILGHDYLQDNRTRIDYGNGKIVTCPPLPSVPKKRGESKTKARSKSR